MRLALVMILAVGCGRGDAPQPPPLVLGELQPDSGHPMGGKVVQITGAGFDTHSTVEVMFGTKPARAIVVAKDRIQLESPPGTEGEEAVVTVKFPDGRGGTLKQKYRWATPDQRAGDADHR
jgi:hypothetical protein